MPFNGLLVMLDGSPFFVFRGHRNIHLATDFSFLFVSLFFFFFLFFSHLLFYTNPESFIHLFQYNTHYEIHKSREPHIILLHQKFSLFVYFSSCWFCFRWGFGLVSYTKPERNFLFWWKVYWWKVTSISHKIYIHINYIYIIQTGICVCEIKFLNCPNLRVLLYFFIVLLCTSIEPRTHMQTYKAFYLG